MSTHDASEANGLVGSINERLLHVAQVLRQANVAWVHIAYQVREGVATVSPPRYCMAGWRVAWPDLSAELHGELVRFFSELLNKRHPSWADIDGVDGLFQWDVCGNILQHVHSIPSGNPSDHEMKSTFVEGL